MVLTYPEQASEWLVEGSTNLLYKKLETWIPKNYRQIACLPITIIIITSILRDRIHNQFEMQGIMAPEQRGGKKDCYGCKDQLVMNSTIPATCRKKKKKNLSAA